MIDVRDLVWKDNETGNLNKIIDFLTYDELRVVLYTNMESLEDHCMDIDMFLLKHSAGGIFNDMEPA